MNAIEAKRVYVKIFEQEPPSGLLGDSVLLTMMGTDANDQWWVDWFTNCYVQKGRKLPKEKTFLQERIKTYRRLAENHLMETSEFATWEKWWACMERTYKDLFERTPIEGFQGWIV